MTLRLSVRGTAFTAGDTLEDLLHLPELLRHYYAPNAPPTLRRVPILARLGLLVALRAMGVATWPRQPDGAPDTALIIGTAFSSVEMSMDFTDSLLNQGPRLSSPTAFSHSVNNMVTGLISLVLGLRGPCQTISQFGLSFAGALHVAALYLYAGRVTRAIVGALDESDRRFDACMPGVSTQLAGMQNGGAVFFCLEKATEDYCGPCLCVHLGEEAIPPFAVANSDTCQGSLIQALRVYYALDKAEPSLQDYVCVDTVHRHTARITVRSVAC